MDRHFLSTRASDGVSKQGQAAETWEVVAVIIPSHIWSQAACVQDAGTAAAAL